MKIDVKVVDVECNCNPLKSNMSLCIRLFMFP